MPLRTFLMHVCVVMFVSTFFVSASAQSALVAAYNGNFGLMDLSTGAYKAIGSTDPALVGLGYSDGKLYAYGVDGKLYTVDPTNAQLAPVGPTGIGLNGMGATYDGMLYAYRGSGFYMVDPATGSSKFIGPLGFLSTSALQGDDLGNLYMTGGGFSQGFYSLDRATGAGTLVGTATYGPADALAFVAGEMYCLNMAGQIYKVNLTDGTSTLVGTFDLSQVGGPWAAVPAAEAHTLTISPSSVNGSLSATGTIEMDGPVPVDTVVQLASSSADASVPASVTVSAGANSQTFTIDTTAVTSPVTVNITATSGRSVTAVLTVTSINVASLTISPTTVVGGFDTATATLTLGVPAPAPITVNLTSSDKSAIVPASVKFANGQQVKRLIIETAYVNQDTPVTITASANGTNASANLTVSASATTKLQISFTPPVTPPNTGYPRGTAITITVTLTDSSGHPLANEPVKVILDIQSTQQSTFISGATDANGQVSVPYTVPTDTSQFNIYVIPSFSGSKPYRKSNASQRIPIG